MKRSFVLGYPASLLTWVFLWLAFFSGCGGSVSPGVGPVPRPGKQLDRALALRESQPLAAAAIFETEGVLPGMEVLRQNLYFDCLSRGHAGAPRWRRYLGQKPPPALRKKASLILAELLIDRGEEAEAALVLGDVEASAPLEVDRLRLRLPGLRNAAAMRMLRRDPVVLHREEPALENQLLPSLSIEDRLERVETWRKDGRPGRALIDLRHLPRAARRKSAVLKSRCELDRGRLHQALSALPRLGVLSPPEALMRAEILRRMAWARFPATSARKTFLQCMAAARQGRGGANKLPAMEKELECAIEGKALDRAVSVWRELLSEGWKGSKRGRMGRRLGIALANTRGGEKSLDPSSVPGQERCLRYWQALRTRPVDRKALEDLGKAAIPDLYARWAMKRLGTSPPQSLNFPQISLPQPEMPESISWLLDRQEEDLAAAGWRHLGALRALAPGEILAAVRLQGMRHRPDLEIRYLRRGFKELGGPKMARYPGDLLKLYLPLRWRKELKGAAREAGIDPWLLAGLARQESIFNAEAHSPAGARGVVQLMPGTARGHARALGLGSHPDLQDPGVNLRIGARELAWLIGRFGALEPALAAYNGGESRVRRWLKKWPDVEEMVENIPVPETYDYLRRVIFLGEAYRLVWAEEWKTGAGGVGGKNHAKGLTQK